VGDSLPQHIDVCEISMDICLGRNFKGSAVKFTLLNGQVHTASSTAKFTQLNGKFTQLNVAKAAIPAASVFGFGPRSCFMAFALDTPNGFWFWPLNRAVGSWEGLYTQNRKQYLLLLQGVGRPCAALRFSRGAKRPTGLNTQNRIRESAPVTSIRSSQCYPLERASDT
jgi:hypothetical protein